MTQSNSPVSMDASSPELSHALKPKKVPAGFQDLLVNFVRSGKGKPDPTIGDKGGPRRQPPVEKRALAERDDRAVSAQPQAAEAPAPARPQAAVENAPAVNLTAEAVQVEVAPDAAFVTGLPSFGAEVETLTPSPSESSKVVGSTNQTGPSSTRPGQLLAALPQVQSQVEVSAIIEQQPELPLADTLPNVEGELQLGKVSLGDGEEKLFLTPKEGSTLMPSEGLQQDGKFNPDSLPGEKASQPVTSLNADQKAATPLAPAHSSADTPPTAEKADTAAPVAQAQATQFAPQNGARVIGASSTPQPIHRVQQTLAALFELGPQKGVSHARLELRPPELGALSVHLKATSDGVVARVIADSPEVARLLQQSGSDLRDLLGNRNINLLSFDVSSFSEGQASTGQEEASAQDATPREALLVEQPSTDSSETVTGVLELPGGVLVDVLA